MELNFFEYSDSKNFFAEPDIVKYYKNNRLQYDLILGTETMKELGIVLDFIAKMITIDEVILPMRNIFVMKLHSTQDATKRATRILDAKYDKADLQLSEIIPSI